MADWIKAQYRPFVRMCKGLYSTPPSKIDSYALNSEKTTSRVAVYSDGDYNVLVLRGTSTHKSDGKLDLADDLVIASGYGTTSLEKEATKILKELKGTTTLTGHSLGGYAALKLAKENNLKCCVFNAGTSPKAPVTTGPGKDGICYHIVGDLISTYISDSACEVVRVDLGLSPLDTLYAHDIDRFSGGDKVKGFLTANQENDLLKGYDALIKSGIDLIGKASPEVMDALNYIMPSLSFDIPDTDSNDDEIATLVFAGISRFAPGLMGVFKRGEKLPVVLANTANEEVKKVKDKGVKLDAYFHDGGDKPSVRTLAEAQKLSKEKQFKSVVSLPPDNIESKKAEATKLYANAKEIKPKLTIENFTKSFKKGVSDLKRSIADAAESVSKKVKTTKNKIVDSVKDRLEVGIKTGKPTEKQIKKVVARHNAKQGKISAPKLIKTSNKQATKSLSSAKKPSVPQISAKTDRAKKKSISRLVETKAIPALKAQVNAKTPSLVAITQKAPNKTLAPNKPVPLNPVQQKTSLLGPTIAANQKKNLQKIGYLGKQTYPKKPAFKLPKLRR